MATPQQPPQQPIYPRDLSLALDRTYAKFTVYTDARIEQLSAQMRIWYEESLTRDNDLANNMKTLVDTVLKLAERVSNVETQVGNIDKRLSDVETFQKALLETYQTTTNTILKSLADSHAALMEQINQLKRPPSGE